MKEERRDIECSGCGRIQRLHTKKIEFCDGYTCSYGSCNKNPDFKIPKPSRGEVCIWVLIEKERAILSESQSI